MFRKNRRQSSVDARNNSNTPRFSLIRALSKLSHSNSASKEAFAVGEHSVGNEKQEKGFFSRLFASSDKEVNQHEAAQLQRKPSLWQRGKSLLKPKRSEVAVDDSVSTIDLPRVRKIQLPKLKLKGSGSELKVDFSNFVLGTPNVSVDTDALLQRMFDLNEQPYLELRNKYVPTSAESAYLSPVMTAVTLSELSKETTEQLHVQQESVHLLQHHPAQEQVYSDDPQLDSPLLSVSGTLEDEVGYEDDSNDMDKIDENELLVPNEADSNSQHDNESDYSTEAQSIAASEASDWSIIRVTEEFGVLEVKEPTHHSDGSIHFLIEDNNGGSGESIVFEDWRRPAASVETETPALLPGCLTALKSTQSLESIPRAAAASNDSFSVRARSISTSMLTGKRRNTLGARISQIVAIFERGLQEELKSTNV